MSQYATTADLAIFGIGEGGTTGISSADLDRHLQAASATADSYIAQRGYTVPLAAWGDDLRSAVSRIAAWAIVTGDRGIDPENRSHIALMKNRDDAIAWLRDVAKGTANLNVAVTSPDRKRAGVARVFGNTKIGW